MFKEQISECKWSLVSWGVLDKVKEEVRDPCRGSKHRPSRSLRGVWALSTVKWGARGWFGAEG